MHESMNLFLCPLSAESESSVKPFLKSISSLAANSAVNTVYEDVSVYYEEIGPTCACAVDFPAYPDGTGDSVWGAGIHQNLMAARIWLCQFTCNHFRIVLAAIALQIALLGVWIVALLTASGNNRCDRQRSSRNSSPVIKEEYVVNAADYTIDPECAQHLLNQEERENEQNFSYVYDQQNYRR